MDKLTWSDGYALAAVAALLFMTLLGNAFVMLVGWVPLLGPLIQIAALALMGMGLARMHRTDTWRGVCAAYTPFLLCCCCYLGSIILIPAMLAGR